MTEEKRLEHIEGQLDHLAKKESFFQKYVFQIVTIVFLAGTGWMTLDNVKAVADDNKARIEQVKEAQAAKNASDAVVAANQATIKEDIKEIKEHIADQDKKLDKILEEVRKAHRDN